MTRNNLCKEKKREVQKMKLKDSFMTHDSEGEQILVDTGSSFAGLVRSNQTAAFIVECLGRDTTEAAIVDAMFARYDAPREVLREDVAEVVAKLKAIGALEV